MSIETGKVVQFHYDLFINDTQIESSRSGEPMAYLHGAQNIISGLETALAGHTVGDHVETTIAPEQGYGLREENRLQRISAKYLKHAGKLKPGMQVQVSTDQGTRVVTVVKVGLKSVDVDGNHPLAGETLRFVVDIVDIRDATADEKAHGHAHGVGGHHH
ncbi:MAG: peptidylprolyl isomerase [Alcanivoracaceae bacterium]|nr:peptidylprolyl isomerase [Alcanivoracaceae bacterium]